MSKKQSVVIRLLGTCAAIGLAGSSWAANVAVFNDPDYVDTVNESASMQASLSSLGHTVTPLYRHQRGELH